MSDASKARPAGARRVPIACAQLRRADAPILAGDLAKALIAETIPPAALPGRCAALAQSREDIVRLPLTP